MKPANQKPEAKLTPRKSIRSSKSGRSSLRKSKQQSPMRVLENGSKLTGDKSEEKQAEKGASKETEDILDGFGDTVQEVLKNQDIKRDQ